MIDDNITIKITRHLKDDLFMDYNITLFSKTPITPNPREEFFWEGKDFNENKITVKLRPGSPAENARIEPDNTGYNSEIIDEIKRILKRID